MLVRIDQWTAIYRLAIMLRRLAASTEIRQSGPGYTSVTEASDNLLADIEHSMKADIEELPRGG
jgi:predicted DNA-binding transcriptional regulator